MTGRGKVAVWSVGAHLVLVAYVLVEVVLPAVVLYGMGRGILAQVADDYTRQAYMPTWSGLGDESTAFDRWTVLAFGGVVLGKVIGVGYVLFGIFGDASEANVEAAIAKLPVLSRATAGHLYAIVDALAVRFSLDPARIELRKAAASRTVGPTVSEVAGRIVIVLPLGALLLADRDVDELRAMISHELAHVAHGDCRLWGVTESARRSLLHWIEVRLAEMFLFVLGWVGWLSWKLAGDHDGLTASRVKLGFITALVVAIPSLIASWLARIAILQCRKQSEVQADAAAAAIVGTEALIRAIDRATSTGSTAVVASTDREKDERRARTLVVELHASCGERKQALLRRSSSHHEAS